MGYQCAPALFPRLPALLTLLTNARLFAPEPLGVRSLLIAGSHVVWIGDGDPGFHASLGVHTRDLEGRRVIPGLVDPHVHITGGGGESGPQSKVPPLALSRFTRNGITSVVGLLGTDDASRHPGELVVAANGLRAEGLSAWCYTAGYHVPPVTITGSVRGDIAQCDPVIGVKTAISDHRSSQPTLDELLRLASEAHVGGLMTGKAGVAHIHVGDGPRGLAPIREALAASELPPRVFFPTHVNRRKALLPEAIALAQAGCHVDITASPVLEGEDAYPAHDALLRYLEAGGPPERVSVSSDGGGCLGVFGDDGRIISMDIGDPGSPAFTLRTLLGAGHALETVLPAFTCNAARHLKLTGKGHIAVGADADLVVLDDRGAITDVMARGRWHLVGGALQVAGTFDEPAARTARA